MRRVPGCWGIPEGITDYCTDPQPFYCQVRIKLSQKCLLVAGRFTSDGTNIVQWTCDSADDKKWKIDRRFGTSRLLAKHSRSCMDGTSSGNILRWSCNGGTNQDFELIYSGDGCFGLRNVIFGTCADLAEGVLDNGANLELYGCHFGDNQLFYLSNCEG